MTIPKFREVLAQFQNQVEHLIHAAGEGVPVATAETGFIKRRDHLAALQEVRDEAARLVEKHLHEAMGARAEAQASDNVIRHLSDRRKDLETDLATCQAANRKLRGKYAHACRRMKELEARLPEKMPAEFRKKSAAWIERLRVKAQNGELE